MALPSQQRFRIYQEVNNLRILRDDSSDAPLTLEQCAKIVAMLERPPKDKKTVHEVTFDQIRTALNLGGNTQFTLEDDKRKSLKGNTTSAILARREHFGPAWFTWSERQQDAIVLQLVNQESQDRLIKRLMKYCLVDEEHAKKIADARLPDGYGSLSRKALARILPCLKHPNEQGYPLTYDKAVQAAGYEHHSHINHAATGEILSELPYYGEYLQRHVGFGSRDPKDVPEKRYGKIANPTVHIGLNQVRLVVNALVKRYGHPGEIILEVANELKRPADHRKKEFRFGKITKDTMRRYCSCAGCVNARQSINQDLNKDLRSKAAAMLGRNPGHYDMEKMRLWNEAMELNGGIVTCPYSGETLGVGKILSNAVEIDHILPHSITLDDGLANKVLCVKAANQIKKERPPIKAKDDFLRLKGWTYEDILARVKGWPEQKRYRFGVDAMERWRGRADTFLARSLNDTRYLSRVAVEYLSLICPQGTRSIPGQMTAKLREELGLDGNKEKGTLGVLGLVGKKNRNDHRHHAVDACVIGITDRGMLQKFSKASASARKKELEKLLDTLEPPWDTYQKHVERAVHHIWVSHKPDHGYEGAMMEETAYRPPHLDNEGRWRTRGPNGQKPNDRDADATTMMPIEGVELTRYKPNEAGRRIYKGYVGGSNYCIEIVLNDKGRWQGEVITTFMAYQHVAAEIKKLRKQGLSLEDARHQAEKQLCGNTSASGKPLVMRLLKEDILRAEIDGQTKLLRVVKIDPSTNVVFAEIHEAGELKKRHADSGDTFRYVNLRGDSFRKAKARRVTISHIGELRDPGFKD